MKNSRTKAEQGADRISTPPAEQLGGISRLKTEQANSRSADLDILPTLAAAALMNEINGDSLAAMNEALPDIARTVDAAAERMNRGGRLVYAGAGTSGRLGVLDASECPPTFGVSPDMVVGVMAGGDVALRSAVEGAEDDPRLGERDMRTLRLTEKDTLIAISASGRSPYCVGALDEARRAGALSVAMVCNVGSVMSEHAEITISMPTGAEILYGSTRLKAGTATKLALNMISTLIMTRLGKVYKNLMVDMRPTNVKLRDRACRMVQSALEIDEVQARELLGRAGDVKTAIVMGLTGKNREDAVRALEENGGHVRGAVKDNGAW